MAATITPPTDLKLVRGFYESDDIRILRDALLKENRLHVDADGLVCISSEESFKSHECWETHIVTALKADEIRGLIETICKALLREEVFNQQILFPFRIADQEHWVTGQVLIQKDKFCLKIHDSGSYYRTQEIENVIRDFFNAEPKTIAAFLNEAGSTIGAEKHKLLLERIAFRKARGDFVIKAGRSDIFPIQRTGSYCGGYTTRLIINLTYHPEADIRDATVWQCREVGTDEQILRQLDAEVVRKNSSDRDKKVYASGTRGDEYLKSASYHLKASEEKKAVADVIIQIREALLKVDKESTERLLIQVKQVDQETPHINTGEKIRKLYAFCARELGLRQATNPLFCFFSEIREDISASRFNTAVSINVLWDEFKKLLSTGVITNKSISDIPVISSEIERHTAFIDLTFDCIFASIGSVEHLLKHYKAGANSRLKSDYIKEELLIISWRINEIEKKYKYNAQSGKIKIGKIFYERNWLLLEYLADAINIASEQEEDSRTPAFIERFAFLDETGKLSEGSELGKLKCILPIIKKVFLRQPLSETEKKSFSDKPPFYMEELDKFVGEYLDSYLLEKMREAIDSIQTSDEEHKREGETVLGRQNQIIVLLRCFEILGESAQNLSFSLRSSFPNEWWKTEDKLKKKSTVHDFRTIIHHNREKVELILRYGPGLIDTCLKTVIPAIRENIQPIKAIKENVLSSKDIAERDSSKIFSVLDRILNIEKNSTKLPGNLIKELMSYISKNDEKVCKILFQQTDLPEEKEFSALIEESIRESEENKSNIIKKFQEAYRALQGYQLTIAEIENALGSAPKLKIDNIEKIKMGIRNAIVAREKISKEEFQQKYLRFLIFSDPNQNSAAVKKNKAKKPNTSDDNAEKIKSANLHQLHCEEELWKLKRYASENLDEKSITELFFLTGEEETLSRETSNRRLKESNEVIERLDFRKKTNFKKEEFEKILGINEKELEEVYQFFTKPSREEKLEEAVSKSSRIKKRIIDEIQRLTTPLTIKTKKQLEQMLQDVLGLQKAASVNIVKNFSPLPAINSETNVEMIIKSLDSSIKNEKEYAEYLDKAENIKQKEKLFKEVRSLEKEDEIRILLRKFPRLAENYYKWQAEISKELLNVILGHVDMEEDEFEFKLKLLNYPDSRMGKIRNEYHKRRHLRDPKKNMEAVEKLLAEVNDRQNLYGFLENILYNEELVHWEEDSFKKLFEKAGYEYSPHFDQLYTKIKKRYLTYQEIDSVVQGIIIEKDPKKEAEVRARIKHILSLNLSDDAHGKLIDEYRNSIERFIDTRKTPSERKEFISHALTILEKLRNKEPVIKSLTDIRDDLTNSIQKISDVFNRLPGIVRITSSDIYQLEYYIEEAGQAAENLIHHPEFLESSNVSFSFSYLNFVAICRKAMAHFPLEINHELLQYITRSLVLDTRLRIEEPHKISLIDIVKTTLPSPRRILTLETLSLFKEEILLTVSGMGFKSNVKIFHQTLGCNIGIQGDMGFLVESDVGEINDTKLIDLELRLNRILNASVSVYTSLSLTKKVGKNLQRRHVEKILERAKDLNDAILEDKFKRIFQDDSWSTVNIRGIGRIDRSDYQERQDFERIFQFLFGRHIADSDLKEMMEDPSKISANFRRIFSEYNLDKENFGKKLINFLQLLQDRVVFPMIMDCRSIRVPIPSSKGIKQHLSYMPIWKQDLNVHKFFIQEYPSLIIDLDKNSRDILSMGVDGSLEFVPSADGVSDLREHLNSFRLKGLIGKLSTSQIKSLDKIFPYLFMNRSSGAMVPEACSVSKGKRALEEEKTELSKTLTIKELWNYNHWVFKSMPKNQALEQVCQAWLERSTVQGKAILINENADGSMVIHWQGHLLHVSKHEKDFFYATNVGNKYKRIDLFYANILHKVHTHADLGSVDELSLVFTTMMANAKNILTPVMDNKRKLNASLFSQSSMVEYAFKEKDLKERREGTIKFRRERLQSSKSIEKIIRNKSRLFVESLFTLIKKEKHKFAKRMKHVKALLILDAVIHSKLDEYYFENEYAITLLSKTMDERQKVANLIFSRSFSLSHPVNTKYDFRKICRENPNGIQDEKLRKVILFYLRLQSRCLEELQKVIMIERAVPPDEWDVRGMSLNPIVVQMLDTQFRELGSKYFIKREDKIIGCIPGLMLVHAYEYYRKFYYIFEELNDTRLVSLFFSNENIKEIDEVVYQVFSDKYTEAESYQGYISLGELILCRTDFSSEVEFQLIYDKEEKMKILKGDPLFKMIQEILDQYIRGIERMPDTLGFSDNYKVPDIANGILGFSSALDRELSAIYAQVVNHKWRRQPLSPSLLIEQLPDKIWLAESVAVFWEGEAHNTSAFKTEISSLDELLNFHGWTEEEKKRYRETEHYRNDEKIIAEYYQFRKHYDELMAAASRVKEVRQIIKKTKQDKQTHYTKKRYAEAYYLEEQLRLYIIAYKKLIEKQGVLIKQIMESPYVRKRVYAVLNDAESLTNIFRFSNMMGCKNFESIRSYILSCVRKIQEKAQEELLEKTGVLLCDENILNIISAIEDPDPVRVKITLKTDGDLIRSINPTLTYILDRKKERDAPILVAEAGIAEREGKRVVTRKVSD